MDSNTHSTGQPAGQPAGPPDDLALLTAAIDRLAAHDLDRLPDPVRAQRVLELRRLLDRLEGHWLSELAGVDARGAAGADQGVQAASTASWLRNRLHMGASAAHSSVRTARALFRGPLQATAAALTTGQVSVAHAAVVAAGTADLPHHTAADAEPTLLQAARRLDPPRLRRVLAHLGETLNPEAAASRAERQHERRGLWLTATFDGLLAVDGMLDPEAGQTLLAALEPLTRPDSAQDVRSGSQRRADALTELARRALEGGRLPKTGGVRPQLAVLVDLDSLQGHPDVPAVGGEVGWAGPLSPQACRRLACDGAVTRVLVSRHPGHHGPGPGHHHGHGLGGQHDHRHRHHGPDGRDPDGDRGLAARLQAALTLLPPILGGAPSQPLELGRTTRVISPAQRTALAVRDGGCVFLDCQRPLAWCEGHHLVHWLDGGPTDLANLILLCRAHHRAVHEGGWRLTRQPDGRLTASPPHRRPGRRRHRAAA